MSKLNIEVVHREDKVSLVAYTDVSRYPAIATSYLDNEDIKDMIIHLTDISINLSRVGKNYAN
jgi:hypothetical protein